MSPSPSQSERHRSASESVRQMMDQTADSLATGARDATEHYVTEPAKDLLGLAKEYARDKPEVACAWAFGLGFIVGWKMKPW